MLVQTNEVIKLNNYLEVYYFPNIPEQRAKIFDLVNFKFLYGYKYL